MIKVSVMYPNSPGLRFDHDYYRDHHMPLIKKRMGAGLKYYSVDKGLAGGAPGVPPAYVAACHLMCDSVRRTPVVQISEVVVENSAKS
jgi:uncharacterized protein (TIGR02118 family)